MIIYIDIIIIINIIIDFLLLKSIDLLLKRNTKLIRIIIASIIGGVSTILLFKINNNYLLFLYKLLISIAMIIISFKYECFSYFKDNLIWLYIVSIILGGTLYMIKDHLTLSNYALAFSSNGLIINIYVFLFISPIILYRYLKINKKQKIVYSNYYDINIYYNDIKLSGTGFLDTGNNLKDPYLNRPIILVNKSLIKDNINTFIIPYKAVNTSGLLEVFKPKKIHINNKDIKNVLIGLSDINFNGIKIILNKEALWKKYGYGYVKY